MKRLSLIFVFVVLVSAISCSLSKEDGEPYDLPSTPSSTNTNSLPPGETNTNWTPPPGYLVYDYSSNAFNSLQKITYQTHPEYFILASSASNTPYGAILYHPELPEWIISTPAFTNIMDEDNLQWYFTNFLQTNIFAFCFSNRNNGGKAWRPVLAIINYYNSGYSYYKDVVQRGFPEDGDIQNRPAQWYINGYYVGNFGVESRIRAPEYSLGVFLTPPQWQSGGQKVPIVQYAWMFKLYKDTSNKYVQFTDSQDYQGRSIDPNVWGGMRLYMSVTTNLHQESQSAFYYHECVSCSISNFISEQQLVETNGKTYFIFKTNGVANFSPPDEGASGYMIYWESSYSITNDNGSGVWVKRNYVRNMSGWHYHMGPDSTHISSSDEGSVVLYTNAPRTGPVSLEEAKAKRLASFSFPYRAHMIYPYEISLEAGRQIQPVWVRIGPNNYVRGIIVNVSQIGGMFDGMSLPDSSAHKYAYRYAYYTYNFFVFVPEEDFDQVTNALQ